MLETQDLRQENTEHIQKNTSKEETTEYNFEAVKKIQQVEKDATQEEDADSILEEIDDEENPSANKEISEVEPVTNQQITEKTIEVRNKLVEYCKNNKTFQETGSCTILINKGTFTIKRGSEDSMSLAIVRPNFKLVFSGNEKDSKKISITKSGTDFTITPGTLKGVEGDIRRDRKTKGTFTIVDGKCTEESFTDKKAIFTNRPQNALMKNLESILKGMDTQIASN